MKTTIIFSLLLSVGASFALDRRHSSISQDEITGYGDFNSDGRLDVLLIERATGTYRIGEQNADGTLSWTPSRPSGMSEPAEIAVGALGPVGELSFALASPDANRVQITVPGASAGAQADSYAIFPKGTGPSSVAAVDLNFAGDNPAQDDLVVVSSDPNDERAIFKNTAGVQVEEFNQPLATAIRRSRSAWLTPGGAVSGYAAMQKTGLDSELVIHAIDDPATFDLNHSVGSFPAGADYVNCEFGASGVMSFVIFTPEKSSISAMKYDPALGFGAVASHDLGTPVRHLSLIANAAGECGLFVVFVNGDAVIYQFDGVNPPVAEQTISPSPGERINGAAAFSDGLVAILAGAIGGGASNVVHRFADDGSAWKLKESTALPDITAMASLGNLALYDADPMIDEEANVIEILQFPDWTSAPMFNPNLMVTVETISTATGGLGGGTVIAVGSPPAGAIAALSNQPRPDVSVSIQQPVLGTRLPAVSISPEPGVYDSYIEAEFGVRELGHKVYYRTSTGAPWQLNSGSVVPPSGTLIPFTVEYYAVDPASGSRSEIHRAAYSFSGLPGELDSDGDGVPDFVEIANGLDPTEGLDSDGDGFGDLEEFLLETNPNDKTDRPEETERLALGSVIDIAVQPASLPGVGFEPFSPSCLDDGNLGTTATRVDVHDLQGSLLGSARTADNDIKKLLSPNALIENVTLGVPDQFLVVGTESVFQIKAPDNHGHELVGLVKSLAIEPESVVWSPSGGTLQDEAEDWIAAARSQLSGANNPLYRVELDHLDTLALLLMERFLIREFKTRGVADADLLDTLSMTPMRDSEEPQWQLTTGALEQLQLPVGGAAWLLHDVYDEIRNCLEMPPNNDVVQMLALSRELYRVANRFSVEQPGEFRAPLDLLRSIIRSNGPIDLPGGYATEVNLVGFELVAASGGPAFVMFKLNQQQRQLNFTDVVIGADGSLSDAFSGAAVELFDSRHRPFVFSEAFDMLAGTVVRVQTYSDRGFTEIFRAEIVSLPQPGANDSDGNLLDDDLEIQYFGGLGNDPFADHDADGYMTLQEFFEGTSPIAAANAPAVAVEDVRPPAGSLEREGVGLAIRFQWPGEYEERIGFSIDHSTDLGIEQLWSDTNNDAFFEGGDQFSTFLFPNLEQRRDFYRIRMYLK